MFGKSIFKYMFCKSNAMPMILLYTWGRNFTRIYKIFKEDFDLSITCETNLKAVNFLDVTLNLTTGKYRLYNKQDSNPLYTNIFSNHPPNIIKNLTGNISN